jgi:D-alanyl-D-alanine carboxypeptidase
MNVAAKSLGMTSSSFADANGYNPASVSTAGDLLRVAAALMTDPSFAAIADMTSVTLPVAGRQASYTPLLGTHGVVGVKSGFTTAAGGCDVLALSSMVEGHPVIVLAAVTGQQGANDLALAGAASLTLANSALAGVHAVEAVTAGERLGSVRSYGHVVQVVAQQTLSVLSWSGATVRTTVVPGSVPRAGAKAGTVVARTVVRAGHQRLESPVGLAGELPAPSLVQRLF